MDGVAPMVPPQNQPIIRRDEEAFVDTLSKREAQQQGPGHLGQYPESQHSSLQSIPSTETPFFHPDLSSAVKSAEAGAISYGHEEKMQKL